MTRKYLVAAAVAGAALLLGACASQNSAPTAAKPAVAQSAPAASTHANAQQMVCSSTPAIGSHISKTTCITKAQYDAQQKMDAKSREALERAQQQQLSPNNKLSTGGGGG